MRLEKGRITKDGQILTEEIQIFFDDRSSDSLDRWGGHFSVPQDCRLDLHVGCRLEMSDGRMGEIVLYRRENEVDGNCVIHFEGISPLAL